MACALCPREGVSGKTGKIDRQADRLQTDAAAIVLAVSLALVFDTRASVKGLPVDCPSTNSNSIG